MLKRVAERGWWLGVGSATVGAAAIAVIATRSAPAPQADAVSTCAEVQVVEPTVVREIAVAHETAPPPAQLLAVIETGAGTINCTLDAVHAPHTVAVFVGLARGTIAAGDRTGQPFYDGLIFHRTVPNFVIQGGDPTGTGGGGPGFEFADEISDALKFDRPGVLAMANRGKDTNGSQFFITDAALPFLNGGYTIFGHCDAPALVHRIASMPTVGADRPDFPVEIESIRIHELR